MTTTITAAAQTVVEAYEYDPYGNVSIKDKSGGGVSTTQVGNPFDFQRRRRDNETGLLYFRARNYDPIAGHWLQRDPLGFKPGANWKEFCVSNPLTKCDPLGTDIVEFIEAMIELAKEVNQWLNYHHISIGGGPSDKDMRWWVEIGTTEVTFPGSPFPPSNPPSITFVINL